MITIFCPTRGRPEMFERLIVSLKSKQSGNHDWEVLALADNDDPKLNAYNDVAARHQDKVRIHLCGNHPTISQKFNIAGAVTSSKILGISDDDIVCEGDKWDEIVIGVAEDDGLWAAGSGMGEGFFFGREFTKAIGYVTPPQIGHYWAITWIKDVSYAAGIGKDASLACMVEHPNESDDTHQWLLRDGHSHIAADSRAYNEGAEERRMQVERIIELKKLSSGKKI